MPITVKFVGGRRSPKLTAKTLREVARTKQALAEKSGHKLEHWHGSSLVKDSIGQYWSVMRCDGCKAQLGYHFGDSEYTQRPKADCFFIIEEALEKPCPATAQGSLVFAAPTVEPAKKRRAKR
jgi:hypothetical protein